MRHVTRLLLIAALLSLPRMAGAQALGIDHITPPLPTSGERLAADVASWGTVIAAEALDAKAAWDAPDRTRALTLFAVRNGTVFGVTQLVKLAVNRGRPCAPNSCGIDSPDSSFYSMHTAFAFSTIGGPRLAFSLPLAIGTGGLRIAAGKHWLTDVLAGAAAGSVASLIR